MSQDILTTILAQKAQEVAQRKQKTPVSALEDIASGIEKPRGFASALQRRAQALQPAIIAEIKKASPSQGVIRENFQPVSLAQDYAMHGATCLSVLTDKTFFQGADVYLPMIRERCPLPVLRKDFMIDPYQFYEARALGADCVLLIVAALSDSQLEEFNDLAHQLGMDVLIEVHDERELHRALVLNTPLIGINNRNLRTFKTDLNTTLTLKSQLPSNRLVVTESGIHSKDDVKLMLDNNIYTFLVGEAFMRAEHCGLKMRELFF